jgi:hypothetical protein
MADKKVTVFVIMPFSAEFTDIYELGIKAACHEVGIECVRSGEEIFIHSILDHIYDQIRKADFIIAEMTGRNANVFYEAGYAHGLKKHVILLTKQTDDIPFDLLHYPHVVHGGSIKTLKEELVKRLKYIAKNPSALKPIRPVNDGAQETDWAKISQQIMNYLNDKDFSMMSFERVRKNINESYTDDLLKELIDRNADKFRRATLSGGKPGIKKLN